MSPVTAQALSRLWWLSLPRLAHPTLPNDEDLQGGQDIFLHSSPLPLRFCAAPTLRAPGNLLPPRRASTSGPDWTQKMTTAGEGTRPQPDVSSPTLLLPPFRACVRALAGDDKAVSLLISFCLAAVGDGSLRLSPLIADARWR